MRLPAILACLVAVGAVSCSGKDKGRDRQVVLYCSVDQAIAEPIIAEFEKRTGIEVRARYDTERSKTVGLVAKIRAEAADPVADVFWSSEVFHTIRLAREGLLAKYDGEQVRDWPKRFADPQGRWYGFALRGRVIGYHTGRVKADEAPKRLEELFAARWKGNIVMARPEFGTTGGDVASWFARYGPEKAGDILRSLKANGVRMVDGNSTAVRMVATGQALVCLTDTDDVYAAKRRGWPVAMNPLDQGGRGALAIPNTVALIKGGRNPRRARELMAFLLSEDVEEMLAASESHNTPIRPALAKRFAAYAIGKTLDLSYERVADELLRAIREAGEILP